jgi:hypothetical protein
VNLKFGTATLAASALIGTMFLGGCTNQLHDKLYDWVSSQSTPNIEGGSDALGVDQLKDVTSSDHMGYLGIGTIGNQCLVSFTALTVVADTQDTVHRVNRTSTTEISLFGRFDDRKALRPNSPLTVTEALNWVRIHRNTCFSDPA